jgi:hypothetical protein
MSSWAEIDDKNVVIRVVVGDNNDPNGDEGYQWLIDNLGGTWVKTSYNAATNGFRYNFAGIGFTYDPIDDAFIEPIPCEHPELTLNKSKKWECTNEEHNVIS